MMYGRPSKCKTKAADGDGLETMMRAVAFLLLPVTLAGVGAAVLHRKGTSTPAALVSPAAARTAETAGEVKPTIVGMNVGSLEYYSGEWAFNDLIQTSAFIFFAISASPTYTRLTLSAGKSRSVA
jgi:hypothetical protein